MHYMPRRQGDSLARKAWARKPVRVPKMPTPTTMMTEPMRRPCSKPCALAAGDGLSGHGPLVQEAEALELHELEADRAAYQGVRQIGAELAQAHRPALLDELLPLAFKPFLARAAEVSRQQLDLTSWGRPWCPFCGSWPEFSVIQEDESRTLICGRCAGRCPGAPSLEAVNRREETRHA